MRLLVLQTFQILVDRHNNREKLVELTLEPTNLDLEGYPNKFNRTDQMFAQKSLYNIFSHFKRVVEEQSNSIEFLEAIYTTCVLLHVETSATDESALYLLDLVDSVQGIAVANMNLSTENRFALHAIAVCLLALLSATVNIAELDGYVDGIVQVCLHFVLRSGKFHLHSRPCKLNFYAFDAYEIQILIQVLPTLPIFQLINRARRFHIPYMCTFHSF